MSVEKMEANCSLCGTKGVLFSEVNEKRYYNCQICKSLFMDPEDYLTIQEEEERYKEHNNDVYDLGYQKYVEPIVKAVQKDYRPEGIGLDYGCGTGPVIAKLLRDDGYQIKLYDPFFANYPEKLKVKYDYIVCCEVMEHFHTPDKEFCKLHSLLKPGGAIFFKTKIYNDDINFEKWSYKRDLTHVFFYRKETLEWIQEHFGFSKVFIDEKYIKFIL